MNQWTYHKFAERDPEMLKVMEERGIKNTLVLTNDGQAVVMEGDTRIALVDMHTPCKRGERWKAECPTRDRNARLIAKAPEMYALLVKSGEPDFAEICRYIDEGKE